MKDIDSIVCPNCGDTFDKDTATNLNMNSARCYRCGMLYVPNENKKIIPYFVFDRIKNCKGEKVK